MSGFIWIGIELRMVRTSGELDHARAVLQRMSNLGEGSAERFFDLAGEFVRAGQESKAVDLLSATKKSMLAARRESEFASALDHLVETFPNSLRLVQFWASWYGEINRETKYFDALVRLFDLTLATDQLSGACEAFEKLVDIDPYDSRNQQRLDQLKGRAGDEFLSRVKSRLSSAATHKTEPSATQSRAVNKAPSNAILANVQSTQTLEDLLVQAEIFVQYSLQSKAIERLQRIVELFPGEQDHNERLQGLFESAHWWPQEGSVPAAAPEHAAPLAVTEELPNRAPVPSLYSPETLRDLAKISEINQNVFRQPSPRAMLSSVSRSRCSRIS